MLGKRDVFFPEARAFVPTGIFASKDLDVGAVVSGPALIHDPMTTIAIGPSQIAHIDGYGNTIIETNERLS